MKELDDIIKKLDKDIADTEARIAKRRKEIFIIDCAMVVLVAIIIFSIVGIVLL